MSDGTHNAFRRLVLPLVAAVLSVLAAAAQDSKPAVNSVNAPAGASIPSTTPALKTTGKPLTPPKGKMRGLTNQMRWEAARRAATRKARGQRQANPQAYQGEVKK